MTHGRASRTTVARHTSNFALIALLSLAALVTVAPGEEITIRPSKDNSLFEEGNLSNGLGAYLFTGVTNANDKRRALLAFDLSDDIPPGSVVTRVELRLRMNRTIAGNRPARLHRLLADWGEGDSNATGEEGRGAPAQTGDATWQRRFFNTQSWTTPGGDFAAAASATRSVGNNGNYTWGSTPELVADVQAWVEDPAINFGWILIGDETSAPTAKRFTSTDGSPASQRPMLTVRFTPAIAAPSATPTPSPSAVPDTETPEPTATVENTATPEAAASATPTTTAIATAAATHTAEQTLTATPEAPPTPTATQSDSHTTTPTETPTESIETPTATAPPASCPGDCNGDGVVTINELVVSVNIALGNAAVSQCRAVDRDDSGVVTINELIVAVLVTAEACS